MECFKVDPRVENAVRESYPWPRVSGRWLRKICLSLVEENGVPEANFTLAKYHQGTGLPNRITQERVYELIEGPIVLELVHLTDIGVNPLSLERVRQHRAYGALQDRIAHLGSSEGQAFREPDSQGPAEQYPRKCLKLFLSDGFIELQAIEIERLPFELGVTPMGTKIRLTNVPIIGGVAYLRRENVVEIGGAVRDLQREHRRRLFEELDRRIDDDEEDAEFQEVPVEFLYASHS